MTESNRVTQKLVSKLSNPPSDQPQIGTRVIIKESQDLPVIQTRQITKMGKEQK